MSATSYASVMARRAEIMRRSVGIDYDRYELEGGIAFDYPALAENPPYGIEDVRRIQRQNKVGDTPLLELRRLSQLVRSGAPPGRGRGSSSRTRRRMQPAASSPGGRQCAWPRPPSRASAA